MYRNGTGTAGNLSPEILFGNSLGFNLITIIKLSHTNFPKRKPRSFEAEIYYQNYLYCSLGYFVYHKIYQSQPGENIR
jgi:hypothetical protein